MSLFTTDDYTRLHALVFRGDFPGYRPEVVEAPNGDATARDTGKRYAHIATKYLDQYKDGWNRSVLLEALWRAHNRATNVAEALGVPEAFMPSFEAGALRVLEYPPGMGSAAHTDVGLLTLNLYRDQPECLRTYDPELKSWMVSGVPEYHLGRLARETGVGPAAPHDVIGSATAQHSLVYFAVPDHEAILPSGQRLGTWLDAEMAKMRYDR